MASLFILLHAFPAVKAFFLSRVLPSNCGSLSFSSALRVPNQCGRNRSELSCLNLECHCLFISCFALSLVRNSFWPSKIVNTP